MPHLIQGGRTGRSKPRTRRLDVFHPDGRREILTFLGHGVHSEPAAPPKPTIALMRQKRASPIPLNPPPGDALTAELLAIYRAMAPHQRKALFDVVVATAKLKAAMKEGPPPA